MFEELKDFVKYLYMINILLEKYILFYIIHKIKKKFDLDQKKIKKHNSYMSQEVEEITYLEELLINGDEKSSERTHLKIKAELDFEDLAKILDNNKNLISLDLSDNG